jgi:hypothetical protein
MFGAVAILLNGVGDVCRADLVMGAGPAAHCGMVYCCQGDPGPPLKKSLLIFLSGSMIANLHKERWTTTMLS